MRYVRGRSDTGFRWANQKEGVHLEDLGIDRRIILNLKMMAERRLG
jgi:hypothetical protein